MKALKASLITLLIVPLVAGYMLVAKAEPAKAQTNLGNAIVLNGLFTGYNAQTLAGLIAVDNMTGGGTAPGTTNLNDLIVLNSLFGHGYGYNSAAGLAGLIAVNNLYGGGHF